MSIVLLGSGDGEYSSLLGFTGNACVDFLRAFNLRKTANGVLGYACDRDLFVAGSKVVISRVNSDGSLAPTYTIFVRSVDSYQSIQGSPLAQGPIDPANVSLVWSAAFGLVIVCYLVSRSVGAMLELIRKG